ncbi:MAG: hypothetical protein Q8880_10095, partial [Bacteroidota bacterium]|nr:hypothetical protein [Bacteroidota bacterium]
RIFIMPALQTISGYVTAPSTTLTALTMGSGDSNVIKAFSNSRAFIIGMHTKSQTAGNYRIRSSNLHDVSKGINVYSKVGVTVNHIADVPQPVVSQDTLIMEMSGSATSGDIEIAGATIYYENLSGSNTRLINPSELAQRAVNIVTNENTLALGTAGGYSGEEALNAENDLLKANTDYALVGYQVSAIAGIIGIRGADTGNLRIGMPAGLDVAVTRNYFIDLSKVFGLPLIPVINSAFCPVPTAPCSTITRDVDLCLLYDLGI